MTRIGLIGWIGAAIGAGVFLPLALTNNWSPNEPEPNYTHLDSTASGDASAAIVITRSYYISRTGEWGLRRTQRAEIVSPYTFWTRDENELSYSAKYYIKERYHDGNRWLLRLFDDQGIMQVQTGRMYSSSLPANLLERVYRPGLAGANALGRMWELDHPVVDTTAITDAVHLGASVIDWNNTDLAVRCIVIDVPVEGIPSYDVARVWLEHETGLKMRVEYRDDNGDVVAKDETIEWEFDVDLSGMEFRPAISSVVSADYFEMVGYSGGSSPPTPGVTNTLYPVTQPISGSHQLDMSTHITGTYVSRGSSVSEAPTWAIAQRLVSASAEMTMTLLQAADVVPVVIPEFYQYWPRAWGADPGSWDPLLWGSVVTSTFQSDGALYHAVSAADLSYLSASPRVAEYDHLITWVQAGDLRVVALVEGNDLVEGIALADAFRSVSE